MKSTIIWKPIGEGVQTLLGSDEVMIPKVDFVSNVVTCKYPFMFSVLNFSKMRFAKILGMPFPIGKIFDFKPSRFYYVLEITAGEIRHRFQYWNIEEAKADRESLMLDIEDFWEVKNTGSETNLERLWEQS